ncbi:hypothetical protein Fmac_011433 [Flemingia macrophylla]|uniref:Uncharacterized protein n=1 Tax=Flemingia macrophylla TaxID=520843 RepID=A0ABD1MMF2_9FABA
MKIHINYNFRVQHYTHFQNSYRELFSFDAKLGELAHRDSASVLESLEKGALGNDINGGGMEGWSLA